jgi:hypothetical protein
LPLPSLLAHTPDFDSAIGNTFLMAGKPDDALVFLSRAAHSCFALGTAIDQVPALERMGQAFARKGDTKGACEAYRQVLARWGEAKPRAVTAEEARVNAARLRCP